MTDVTALRPGRAWRYDRQRVAMSSRRSERRVARSASRAEWYRFKPSTRNAQRLTFASKKAKTPGSQPRGATGYTRGGECWQCLTGSIASQEVAANVNLLQWSAGAGCCLGAGNQSSPVVSSPGSMPARHSSASSAAWPARPLLVRHQSRVRLRQPAPHLLPEDRRLIEQLGDIRGADDAGAVVVASVARSVARSR